MELYNKKGTQTNVTRGERGGVLSEWPHKALEKSNYCKIERNNRLDYLRKKNYFHLLQTHWLINKHNWEFFN